MARPITANAETITRVRQARDRLAVDLGRAPKLGEIGTWLGITRERVRQVLVVAGDSTNDWKTAKTADIAARLETRQRRVDQQRAKYEARDVKIIALYDSGLAQGEIGRRLGLSQHRVSDILCAHGKSASADWHRWTIDEHVRLLRRRGEGLTYAELGVEFGISTSNASAQVARLRKSNPYACEVRARVATLSESGRSPVAVQGKETK